jgi:predicted anti-sigma-YlaC factor YlaD
MGAMRQRGGVMNACSFDRLLQFVNKQLDLDGQLEVYGHLDQCDICRDAVYQLSRDRDEASFIYRAHRVKPSVFQHPIEVAIGSPSAYR